MFQGTLLESAGDRGLLGEDEPAAQGRPGEAPFLRGCIHARTVYDSSRKARVTDLRVSRMLRAGH